MTKRRKILLLSTVILALAAVGTTISMLIKNGDSSQGSDTDTSSQEVSVSTSSPLASSNETISVEISESNTTSNEDSSESSEINESRESASDESADSNSSAPQTSDSMSASSDHSSPEFPSPTQLVSLGAHGLTIPQSQATQGVQFSFTAPETGTYDICSQSIAVGGEDLALVYTLRGDSGYITSERQLFTLQENEIILFTAYVYDSSLFKGNSFVMDLTLTRQLTLGENNLTFSDACVVYFIPPADGEYTFNASEGVYITYYSYDSLKNEVLLTPLTLTAGEELRLVLQTNSETSATITITTK